MGIVVGIAFDFAYQNNFLGLQDGLDWSGSKVDEGIDWAGKKIDDSIDYAKEKLDDVGEALNGIGDAINPMNWSW